MSHKAVSGLLIIRQKCPLCEKEWFMIDERDTATVKAVYTRHFKAAHPNDRFKSPFVDFPDPIIYGSSNRCNNRSKFERIAKSIDDTRSELKKSKKTYADFEEKKNNPGIEK